MAIASVDEVMLREPRLLVPGMQPLGPVKVDKLHPAANRLCFAWVASNQNELISNTLPDTNTADQKVINGQRVRSTDETPKHLAWHRELIKTSDGAGTGAFTVIVRANPTARNSLDVLLCQKYDDGGGAYSQFILCANTGSGFETAPGSLGFVFYGNVYVGVSSNAYLPIDGTFRDYCGVRENSGPISIYVDGAHVSTAYTANICDIADSYRRTGIGYSGKSNSEDNAVADFVFAYVWDRALTATEIMAITKDPYQFLIPA